MFRKILLTCVLDGWDHFETTLDSFMGCIIQYFFHWVSHKFISSRFTQKYLMRMGEESHRAQHMRLPLWLTVITTHWTVIWSMNPLNDTITPFSFINNIMYLLNAFLICRRRWGTDSRWSLCFASQVVSSLCCFYTLQLHFKPISEIWIIHLTTVFWQISYYLGRHWLIVTKPDYYSSWENYISQLSFR